MNFHKLEFGEWEIVEFRIEGNGVTSSQAVPYLICEVLSGANKGQLTRLFQPKPTSKSYESWKETFGADLDAQYGSIFKASAMPKFKDMQFFCQFKMVKENVPDIEQLLKDFAEIPF